MEPYAPYPLNVVRDWLDRRRWWVRLAVAIVLVPLFGHFAYTRWTTPPARPGDPTHIAFLDSCFAKPDPSVDRTKDMVAAINRLPAEPTLAPPSTAPSGMRWLSSADAERLSPGRSGQPPSPRGGTMYFDVTMALCGEWTPATRYHLQQIVAYIELPQLESALAEIAALSDKPFCVSVSTCGLGSGGMSQIRRLAKLLTARARYYMAAKHDFKRAARDIETIFQLAAGTEDDQTLICMLIGIACRSLACIEAARWPREFDLTHGQVQELIALLERHTIDRSGAWALAMRGEASLFEALIDQMYTQDEHGDGWLVFHHGPTDRLGDQLPRCFNLLSPLFEDRRTARDSVRRYQEQLADPRGRSYHETFQALEVCAEAPIKPTSRLFFFAGGSFGRAYTLLARTQIAHVGAVVALGLAAYRSGHGRYPEDLSMLVPEYLSELPDDPFTDRPLRYRLDEEKGYLLYSVDHNGVDDGGVQRSEHGEELDWPISEPRKGLEWGDEWLLIPANEPEGQDADGQPE